MILLAMNNTQTILLIVLGLAIVSLVGWLIISLAKNKLEKELDLVSIETMLDNDDKPVVVKVESSKEFDTENQIDKPKDEVKKEPLSEIELVLAKMQNDLDKDKKEAISTFEEEQEEKSIISYQELKAAKDKIVPYKDELEENQIVYPTEPVETIDKLEEDNQYIDDKYIDDDDKYIDDKKNENLYQSGKGKTNHFSNSEFISPVYGRLEEKKLDYPKIASFKDEIDNVMYEPEEVAYEPLTVDYDLQDDYDQRSMIKKDYIDDNYGDAKKSQEFLKELKNFRDNLK